MTEKQKIQKLLDQGEILQAEKQIGQVADVDTEILILRCLFEVFHAEVETESVHTVFEHSLDIAELSRWFIRCKLLLRRIDFDLLEKEQEEVLLFAEETGVSECLLAFMILHNMIHKEKVCQRLAEIYREKEGADSRPAAYFEQLLANIRDQRQENRR